MIFTDLQVAKRYFSPFDTIASIKKKAESKNQIPPVVLPVSIPYFISHENFRTFSGLSVSLVNTVILFS